MAVRAHPPRRPRRSPRRRVGVIGSKDSDATYVAAAVDRQGGEAVFVDSGGIPELQSLTWDGGEVRYRGERLDELRVFYLKGVHLSLPLSPVELIEARQQPTWQERWVAERERNAFITSVLRNLRAGGRHFVNPVECFDLHLLKLHQLALLEAAGVPVPRTLATSDPEAVRAFAARHRSIVYKPFAGGATVQRLGEEDLTDARLGLLSGAPVLFQEEIRGDEFRAYVLDGEPVQAFRIPTRGVVDARVNLGKHGPAKLPDEAWELCRRGARALGLVFTAADVRRTRDGRYVILELNPTPAISFFEDPREGKIVSRLADHLLAHA